MTIPVGTKLGLCEIAEPLGAGGMGEVYLARGTRLDRDVAIKVLPEALGADEDFRRRFKREAKTISQLSHTNVCTLHDVGAHDGRDFLVMELLEGETLEERLKRGPLALDELLRVGMQIAEAIEAAHRRGVVHRDLKPGNVMLTPTGAKVLDFGLAKEVAGGPTVADSQVTTVMQEQTTEDSIVGTLHYMAPEQLEGKESDRRSDLFALGVVLYEMATGLRPFRGDSQASLIASILRASPEPIHALQPDLPPRLGWVFARCLRGEYRAGERGDPHSKPSTARQTPTSL